MKVAFVVSNVVSYHHARYDCFARKDGIEASMIQVTSRDMFQCLEFHPDAPAYQLHTLYTNRLFKDIPIRQLYKKCIEFLHQHPQDVVCASGWGGIHGIALIAAANKLHIPVVVFSESNEFDFPRSRLAEAVKREIVSCCSAGLVGGSMQKSYLVKLGMSPEKIEFGHNVVDTKHFFCSTPERPREKCFLACAKLEPKKNHAGLLRGYQSYCRQVRDPWRLQIAGPGMLHDELVRQCNESNLDSSAILLGSRNYDELPSLYQQAGAFIHPSLTEQWGLVVNEAMAAACPVLVSNRCGCAADLVHEGVNGFTFDPTAPDEIAAAMLKIHQLSEAQLASMRIASQRIIADWTPERFAKGLKRCCEMALEQPATPGIVAKATVSCLLALSLKQ